VLAKAMKVLETCLGRNTENHVVLDGSTDSPKSYWKNLGGKTYRITYTRDGSDETKWQVSIQIITPEDIGSSPTPLPENPP
jgi:hypothetical protein